MTAALDRATAALGDANVRAFLQVIREGESSHEETAYTIINGGQHFTAPPWRHPFHGISTTAGGRAAGAYQFLGTTWARCADALGLGEDFSPPSQDAGAVYLIEGRGALSAVMAGKVGLACDLLAKEWVSLPGLGDARAASVFATYGGTPQNEPGTPISTPPLPSPVPQPEKPMGALALLQIFGPILSGLIPQIKPLLAPGTDKTDKYAGIAQIVLDTINKAAGQPNLQASVEAMQSDPTVKKTVQQAIVSHPDIINSLTIGEVGGGVGAARDADLKAMIAEVPFWKGSAVFYVSILLLPIVYWLVGSLIVGGIIPALKTAGVELPSWGIVLLALFGGEWEGETRSGGFNLVIGLILGGICGVYYGVSVTQAKAAQQQQQQSDKPVTT